MADRLSELTPVQAGELAHALEKAWGVSAARSTGPAPIQAPEAEKAPEQMEFDVILIGFDEAKKIAVVREVRQITALGLKESMAFVNEAPKALKEAISRGEAEAIKMQVEAAGGKVEIK